MSMTTAENKLMKLSKEDLVRLVTTTKEVLDQKAKENRSLNEQVEYFSREYHRMKKILNEEEDIDLLLC